MLTQKNKMYFPSIFIY